ncbi:DUF4062 domain-containing protein [Ruminiclostridium papyrosolvens]|uniref:DUF4062 domain-containing protein n=1 Tax=Ruminiclostridium papyrosolvens C7 TaxID=1330534 RepID=U4R354_9FIRM|nr:DUF4062 domain-containing protein [Ruminiclostridium papyrosolvens]EPR12034.1 hypothetical protein L323_09770 [Ruminiclostridium papyrosolvens C7]
MEKRYQIFISSTFRDLQEERQAVLKSVLELNHMPAGMELFPATDDSAWQLIKDVIDASDYYVLIIAGRYGSVDEKGIGYTEKEYEYALKTNKPVIPLLHKNPDELSRDKTEINEVAWNKLKEFREKVEKKHTCVYWSNADELKAKVIIGLTAAVKRYPTIGWVRADKLLNQASMEELLRLKSRVSELEKEINESNMRPPIGSEALMQDDERIDLHCSFQSRIRKPRVGFVETNYNGTFRPSWNQIFSAISPSMISETTEDNLRHSFKVCFEEIAKKEFLKEEKLKDSLLFNFKFKNSEIDTCIIQFRALGLITESKKQRSVKDTSTYWKLTLLGDSKMVQLRAIRKESNDEVMPISAEEEGNL